MSYIIQRRMNNNSLFRIHNPQLSRNFAIMRVLSSVLKLRYLILGGAVGGGMTISKVCCTHCQCCFLFLYVMQCYRNIKNC